MVKIPHEGIILMISELQVYDLVAINENGKFRHILRCISILGEFKPHFFHFYFFLQILQIVPCKKISLAVTRNGHYESGD